MKNHNMTPNVVFGIISLLWSWHGYSYNESALLSSYIDSLDAVDATDLDAEAEEDLEESDEENLSYPLSSQEVYMYLGEQFPHTFWGVGFNFNFWPNGYRQGVSLGHGVFLMENVEFADQTSTLHAANWAAHWHHELRFSPRSPASIFGVFGLNHVTASDEVLKKSSAETRTGSFQANYATIGIGVRFAFEIAPKLTLGWIPIGIGKHILLNAKADDDDILEHGRSIMTKPRLFGFLNLSLGWEI